MSRAQILESGNAMRIINPYRYAVGGVLPPAASVALWLFNDGSGQTLSDSSGNGRDLQLGSTSGSDTDDPTWSVDGGVSCLNFGGTGYCTGDLGVDVPQGFSFACMYKRTTHSDYQTVMSGSGGLVNAIYLLSTGVAAIIRFGAVASQSVGALTGGWDFLACNIDGASSGIRSNLDSFSSETTGTDGLDGTPTFYLGGATDGRDFAGCIAAAVILPAVMSEGDADNWHAYFKAVKGGLA